MKHLILLAAFFALCASNASAQRCGCPRQWWGPDSFRAYILFEDKLVPVVVDDVNGEAVFGGDVFLGSAKKLREDAALIERAGGADAVNSNQSLVPDSARNGNRPWPNRVVPYSGVSSLSPRFRREFKRAVAHWERLLGGDIEFRPRRRGDARYMRVRVVPGRTCSWRVPSNTLSLGGGASGKCARHEIGHALGLAHEHNRHDRNTFVTVLEHNIKRESCSQFDMLPAQLSVGDYDLSSVMHYFPRGQTCNGRPTLAAVPPGRIGRRNEQITAGDVAGVRRAQGIQPGRNPTPR